jgi:hypothetical protein
MCHGQKLDQSTGILIAIHSEDAHGMEDRKPYAIFLTVAHIYIILYYITLYYITLYYII